jgi:hypothetical protein
LVPSDHFVLPAAKWEHTKQRVVLDDVQLEADSHGAIVATAPSAHQPTPVITLRRFDLLLK